MKTATAVLYRWMYSFELPSDIWLSFVLNTSNFFPPQRDNFVPETIIFIYVAFYTF